MRKKTKIILMMCLTLFISGCSLSSPSRTIDKYVKYLKSNNTANAIGIPNTSSSGEILPEADQIAKILYSNIDVKVLKESIDGNKATVNVEVSGIDYGQIVNDVIDANMTYIYWGLTLPREFIYPKILEEVKGASTKTRKGNLTLNKVDNKWEIDFNDEFYYLMLGQ